MPNRRDLFSGRIEFPWRSWGPRETFDPNWALALLKTDVHTVMFTDNGNSFDVGSGNYHHFFDAWHFVRGHVNDHCVTAGSAVQPGRKGLSQRIYEQANQGMDSEEKTFVARNMSNVAAWLDQYGRTHQPFFLYVDEFDPHAPYDPPEPYRSMYLKDKGLLKKGLRTSHGCSRAEDCLAEELDWLKAQYAGKLTLVDRWFGHVLDCMDKQGLWENTLFLLTTDHGDYLGEYGLMGKGSGPSYPFYARIPLFIHYPQSPRSGQSVDVLSSVVDLHPTVLETLGVPPSKYCQGHSLLPFIQGASPRVRSDVVYGWWGKGFYWTDGRHIVCKAPEKPGPLYQYGTSFGEKHVGLAPEYFDRYANAEVGRFMPHTDRPVYRVPSDGMAYANPRADEDALFDMETDPECLHNLSNDDRALRERCLKSLVKAMRAIAVPEEHFERLGLQGWS
jgi:arylsulfatase A-like enzyme